MRQVTERDFRLPEFADAKVEDYEFRSDGKLVRKDRWEKAIFKLVHCTEFSVRTFEIPAMVQSIEFRVELLEILLSILALAPADDEALLPSLGNEARAKLLSWKDAVDSLPDLRIELANLPELKVQHAQQGLRLASALEQLEQLKQANWQSHEEYKVGDKDIPSDLILNGQLVLHRCRHCGAGGGKLQSMHCHSTRTGKGIKAIADALGVGDKNLKTSDIVKVADAAWKIAFNVSLSNELPKSPEGTSLILQVAELLNSTQETEPDETNRNMLRSV